MRGELKALGARATVTAAAETGLQVLLEGGGRVDLGWGQLQPSDWRGFAVALAGSPGTPEDHALAAFFLLAAGEAAKAKGHLDRAGDGADAVRDAFGN